jgi:hypothetical protein
MGDAYDHIRNQPTPGPSGEPGQVVQYQIRDSGKRAEFAGGMVRDTNEGKLRPDLVRDGPMLNRWIIHLTNGAIKYEARNWLLGLGDPEVLERAFESCDRHYHQWREGHTDEDHAAAVYFNINQVEAHKEVAEDAPEYTAGMHDG